MSKKNTVLHEEQQAKLIELLNRRLADAIDLQLQSRQACWNVKGPHFMALRELFDQVTHGVEEDANLMAARMARRRRSPGGLRSTRIGLRRPMGTATSMRFRRRSPPLADMHATPASRRAN